MVHLGNFEVTLYYTTGKLNIEDYKYKAVTIKTKRNTQIQLLLTAK